MGHLYSLTKKRGREQVLGDEHGEERKIGGKDGKNGRE